MPTSESDSKTRTLETGNTKASVLIPCAIKQTPSGKFHKTYIKVPSTLNLHPFRECMSDGYTGQWKANIGTHFIELHCQKLRPARHCFQGFVVVTFQLVENLFPLFCLFLSPYRIAPAQITHIDTDFGHCLFPTRCIDPSLFRPWALYLRLFYRHLVQSQLTRLGAACFVSLHFRFIAQVGRLQTFRSLT